MIAVPTGDVLAGGGGGHDGDGYRRVVVHEKQSIQKAIDRARPGTKIVVKGHHEENVWIHKNRIELVGAKGDSQRRVTSAKRSGNTLATFSVRYSP